VTPNYGTPTGLSNGYAFSYDVTFTQISAAVSTSETWDFYPFVPFGAGSPMTVTTVAFNYAGSNSITIDSWTDNLNFPLTTPTMASNIATSNYNVSAAQKNATWHLQFFFVDDAPAQTASYGPLCFGRITDANSSTWYRNVRPWAINIKHVISQRADVTILNNVINPDRGEKTSPYYFLSKDSTVTIMVFDLSGDVITVHSRGPQKAGGEGHLLHPADRKRHRRVSQGARGAVANPFGPERARLQIRITCRLNARPTSRWFRCCSRRRAASSPASVLSKQSDR